MPSRAELSRGLLEPALRVVALGALAWALWRALAPPAAAGLVIVDEEMLPGALRRWSASAAPDSLHAALAATPGAETRDWLAAFAASGTHVTWSARETTPIAVAVAPVTDPAGGV